MSSYTNRRDPILQVNVQIQNSKPIKTAVPSYMKITNWLESKPKGIGRGQFFEQSEGSFRLGREEPATYKPTKKVYPVIPPYSYEKPEGTKKIVVLPGRDPILNPAPESSTYGKKVKNTAFTPSTHENSLNMHCSYGKQSQ